VFASGDGTQNGHTRYSIDVRNRPVYAHAHLVQALLHSPQPVPTFRYQVRLIPHQRAQHVARKLAVLLHHLWISCDEYEPLHNTRKRRLLAA